MLPKGMRDLPPEEKILQMEVLDLLRKVFELYGYLPLETPIVERLDVLCAKFAIGVGTDVSKEIFQVHDQGGRGLGLRFDMTVPLCRYVAMNPSIKLPFKRYVIGKVFRDGPIKLGRYREFWQADADIIGVPGILADIEGVEMAAQVFHRLELPVTLFCSSRELLHELMEAVGIEKKLRSGAIIALDKLKKIAREGVLSEMKASKVPMKKAEQLLELTDLSGSNEEKMKTLKKFLKNSHALSVLESILNRLNHLDDLVFDPSLSRGLEYYTGFFFECSLKKSKMSSSLVGTGRYDKMIGQYLGGKQQFAACGISFGVSVICDALREKGYQAKQSLIQVYVVPVTDDEHSYAQEIAAMLRGAGINTDMDLLGRSIGKNFSYANALGIPFVVVVGETERKARSCTIKNMQTGKQEMVSKEELVQVLRS